MHVADGLSYAIAAGVVVYALRVRYQLHLLENDYIELAQRHAILMERATCLVQSAKKNSAASPVKEQDIVTSRILHSIIEGKKGVE